MWILGIGAPPHVTRYQSISYTYRKLGQSGSEVELARHRMKRSVLEILAHRTFELKKNPNRFHPNLLFILR